MFGRMLKKSEELFLQMTTSLIDDGEPIEHQEIMMHDVNKGEKTGRIISFSLVTLLMIKSALHL